MPWVLGLALVAFIGWGLVPKPVAVDAAEIARGPMTVTVLEEGQTRIRNRYVVSPPIAGFLRRVPVRAGDAITEGETVLAEVVSMQSSILDPRERARAEAAVKSAEAARMQSEQRISSANSELKLARKELERTRQLSRKGAVSGQEYDTAENRVDLLQNQLESAKFGLNVAEFELAQARAVLTHADNPEDRVPVVVKAPVSGAVLNVFEESARAVTAGLPIMEVGDPSDIEMEIELLSSDAVNVHPGSAVSVEHWGGDEPLNGTVTVVEPGGFTKISALGVEEQRVKVRADFGALPEGVFGDRYRVEARITTWSDEDVLKVPVGALFRRGNEWMTFVIDGGEAVETPVEIGHNDGIDAEVLSGLEAGTRVILHPPDSVADGARVQLR
ncbi:MAG: HlyD family efflux transporter periplasmic adaptor subunit [Chthoniobacterales bacterium]